MTNKLPYEDHDWNHPNERNDVELEEFYYKLWEDDRL